MLQETIEWRRKSKTAVKVHVGLLRLRMINILERHNQNYSRRGVRERTNARSELLNTHFSWEVSR